MKTVLPPRGLTVTSAKKKKSFRQVPLRKNKYKSRRAGSDTALLDNAK